MSDTAYDCFAITAPGIEPIVVRELERLGIVASGVERGGVSWSGGLADVYRANLHLRTASRVIVRVRSFEAKSFATLERHAKKVPWSAYVTRGRPVRFRVTCRKSRLYHSDAVIQRLAEAVAPVVGDETLVSAARGTDEVDAPDAQLFVVRVDHDMVTISADSSGALLHRRGYRQAIGKAPLRETLAAAMVLGGGWDPNAPLIDPFCGSGTIPIEAAMLARRMAPGLSRRFACLEWPKADRTAWATLVERARDDVLDRAPALIRASDRDAGAIAATLDNAERAGVAADLDIVQQSLSAAEPAGSRGWLVTNPPYGIRVSDSTVRNLYAQLGNVLRRTFPGWNVGILSAYDTLIKQTRVPLERSFDTSNGGIPVRYGIGVVTSR